MIYLYTYCMICINGGMIYNNIYMQAGKKYIYMRIRIHIDSGCRKDR
jgi:hypothetical protein